VKTVTTEIPVTELKVQPLKTEKLRTVEASMRLDAIASAGFRMSRSKMVTKVKNGDVRVNWLPCTKASVDVKEGDLIACAGKGRVEVGEVSQTKKGRFAVELKRIL
jgi:RNA-binding protein YlmH